MKKTVVFILCVLTLVKVLHWWDSRGEGFRLHKIQSTPAYDPRWDVEYSAADLAEAKKALDQTYHYLGHGFQVYAFESSDGKYVLKFFRHQRLRLPNILMAMPSLPYFDEWRKSKLLSLSRRYEYLMKSCKTSWDAARYETALLMVHLNTTKNEFPSVLIDDLLGNHYTIPLDDYQFMLQRKAQHIKPTIAALVKEGRVEEAKEYINKIFNLFVECARKGIIDTDGALVRKNNLGYFDGRAIYIDGGKLQTRDAPVSIRLFLKDVKRLYLLHKWLKQEYPELVGHFDQAKEEAIAKVEMMHELHEKVA